MSGPLYPPSPFWTPERWRRDQESIDVLSSGAQNIQALIRGWRQMETVLRKMVKQGVARQHHAEFLADLRVAQEQIRELVKLKATADSTIPVYAPYRLPDHFKVGDAVMYHPLISTAVSSGLIGYGRRSGWVRRQVVRYVHESLVIDSWMMLGVGESKSHLVAAHVLTPHCLSLSDFDYLLGHPSYAEEWIEANPAVAPLVRRTFLESLRIERMKRRIRIR